MTIMASRMKPTVNDKVRLMGLRFGSNLSEHINFLHCHRNFKEVGQDILCMDYYKPQKE